MNLPTPPDPRAVQQIDQICDAYEAAWHAGQRPQIEDVLSQHPPSLRNELLEELLLLDSALRAQEGSRATVESYCQRFPDSQDLVRKVLGSGSNLESVMPTQLGPDVATDEQDGALPSEPVGRYQLQQVLGRGGFGVVYLAHDQELDRQVALKIPHASLVALAEEVRLYRSEARTVAHLDHPHIVPVYDVGSTDKFPFYVVAKYIEGTTLATWLKENSFSYREAAELLATVADALHYAHKRGVVHRDVKPGNILIDGHGKAYVVDFGLALREENVGQGPRYAGTPAYMSPEQARGEGHRVDGRSDIFSLGTVLYEMLTGKRPFQGTDHVKLLEQITGANPWPLRQHDDGIPRELERICMKSLAKRASDRYTTARDLAEDLRHFLETDTGSSRSSKSGSDSSIRSVATPEDVVRIESHLSSKLIRIIPQGLRSFEAHDADFFLELLPGPRDRHGLPDSIRFWKTRIEQTDPDRTFAVGLCYGPSGCGKTSLFKAGPVAPAFRQSSSGVCRGDV